MSNCSGEADNPFLIKGPRVCLSSPNHLIDNRTSPRDYSRVDDLASTTAAPSDIGAVGPHSALGASLVGAPAASRVSATVLGCNGSHSRGIGSGGAAAAAAAALENTKGKLHHGRPALPTGCSRNPSGEKGTTLDRHVDSKVFDELQDLEVSYREEVDSAIQQSVASAADSYRSSPRQSTRDCLESKDADLVYEEDYVDINGTDEFGRLRPTYLEEVVELRSKGLLHSRPCSTSVASDHKNLSHNICPFATSITAERPCTQGLHISKISENSPSSSREQVQEEWKAQMLQNLASEDSPSTRARDVPEEQSRLRINEDVLTECPQNDLDVSHGDGAITVVDGTRGGESERTNAVSPEPYRPVISEAQPRTRAEGARVLNSDLYTDFNESESLRIPFNSEEHVESVFPEDVEFQRKVREIVAHPTMTDSEKNARRQALFADKYNRSRNAEAEIVRDRVVAQAKDTSYSSVIDPNTGQPLLGCKHYARNCKIQAKCCGLWCVCRLCHDAQDIALSHAINRKETERVMCMFCFEEQPVSNQCTSCEATFARYFCSVCVFYDNSPDKDVYHCDDCGICRVGKGLGKDNFHCEKCNACVSMESRDNHKCIAKSLDANCPICSVYLFTSTDPVVFMRCGHTMHSHCMSIFLSECYLLCFSLT
jgi:hypothetical protein